MLGVGHMGHFYVSREKNIEYFQQEPCILNCKTQCVKRIYTHNTHTHTHTHIYIHTQTLTQRDREWERGQREAWRKRNKTQ